MMEAGRKARGSVREVTEVGFAVVVGLHSSSFGSAAVGETWHAIYH